VANPIAAFNDSTVGIILSVAFHTLGAVGFLGGLVGYIAWQRQLQHGHHNRKVLNGSVALTYLAIFVNLLGGFMRTFESDHPTLEQFGESAWVRAIAIKHVFLFTGMAAAVYLFERVAPRLIRAFKEGRLAKESLTGHKVGVFLVALGIVVAGILGGVSAAYPPVAMTDHAAMTPTQTADTFVNATGQLTTSPLQMGTAKGSFDVMNGTMMIMATLSWTPTQFALTGELDGPGGAKIPITGSNGQATGSVELPAQGHWTYTIRSDLSANVQWTISLHLSYGEGHHHEG
jgi:hypothetical protein